MVVIHYLRGPYVPYDASKEDSFLWEYDMCFNEILLCRRLKQNYFCSSQNEMLPVLQSFFFLSNGHS